MLKLTFRNLDIDTIKSIEKWKYSESDDGLYVKPYHDSFAVNPNKLKGPDGCDGYGVYFEDRLFGLFEFKFVDDELEIGCALEPSVKGKGHGVEFVLAGISFGVSRYKYKGSRVLLDVAVSNAAARKVYDRAGFEVENRGEKTIRMAKTLGQTSSE